MNQPRLPVPPPLRGADEGSFTEDTIKRRLPDIARRVLAENDLVPEVAARINQLIHDIPYVPIRPLTDTHAPDSIDWQQYMAAHPKQNWLQISWFFAETYFYRRIIEAVDFFATGYDPFIYQKQQGLKTQIPGIRALGQQVHSALKQGWQINTFLHLLMADLWGNQADLSMWSVDEAGQPNHDDDETQRSHTIINDSLAVARHLDHIENGRVDFIIDNAGLELVGDLCLANYLLSSARAQTVVFHLKLHPTFVSDALIKDVQQTLAFLMADEAAEVRVLGERLAGYLADGRFQLHTHPFWTSPLPMWQMPADLRQALAPAHLVISKGDANYRRCLGDAHWPYTTSFHDVVSYFPAPLVALRTCKSEVIVGLQPGQSEMLTQTERDWITNGNWGVIQFVENGAM